MSRVLKAQIWKSPEEVCHLCNKCIDYAENWTPTAERLMKENPQTKFGKKEKLIKANVHFSRDCRTK